MNVYQLGEIYFTSWRVAFIKNLSYSDWAKQDFFANVCLYKNVSDLFSSYVESQILPVNLIIMLSPSESVVQKCSVKKVFLEISQNSQDNICARVSFLIKLEGTSVFLWILWNRTPFYIKHFWWLLLILTYKLTYS